MRIATNEDAETDPAGAEASASASVPVGDLTTRARIRDAAIECFAQQGFRASVRTIAARAGVSAGLITHHFGSKAGLRDECDAEVLRRYRAMESENIPKPRASMTQVIAGLTGADAAMMVYILRAIQAGGASARRFTERLVDQVRAVMAESLAVGLVRPSRDEDARARFLTYAGMGWLLVKFLVEQPRSPQDFSAASLTHDDGTVLAMLELYTEGVLTDRSFLDDYVENLWPGRDKAAGSNRPHGPHERDMQ